MKKIVKNDGFTLMEVMIAIIILTISLLLLMNMAMIALDGNDWSNRATQSTQLIQQKLEDLRTARFINSGIDTVNSIQRSWTVSSPANHLRRVDITASWRNRRGALLANSMTAYVKTDSL